MSEEVNLYDSHYDHLAADPQVEVRRETYGEDLGQASWITAGDPPAYPGRRLPPGRRAETVVLHVPGRKTLKKR